MSSSRPTVERSSSVQFLVLIMNRENPCTAKGDCDEERCCNAFSVLDSVLWG